MKHEFKRFLLHLKNSFEKNKKEWQIFGLVLIFALIAGLASLSGYYFFTGQKKMAKERKVITEVVGSQGGNEQKLEEKKVRRLIDGVLVESDLENILPVGIMIDNFIEARPSSGLSKASLVFEAPTEAGIPRFLAVYAANEEIKEIGPIRSARPYYLDWLKEFGGLYLHVGGSEEALWKIKKYNIFDLNEYYNEWYFWRDPNRVRPYNVYTSSELIKKALNDLDASETGDYRSWNFKDEAELTGRGQDGQKISFNFSSRFNEDYAVSWQYNQADNNYERWQTGSLQQEKDGGVIKAKNIVIQFCEMEILDEVGRRRIGTVGSGEALIFQDGQMIKGKWRKAEMGARTVYYYEDEDVKRSKEVEIRSFGADHKDKNENKDENEDEEHEVEVEFNAGTTWVEVLPVGSEVEY